MRVIIPAVAVAVRRVDVHIRDHAAPDKLFPHKIFYEVFPLLVGEFMRQGNLNLSRRPCVFLALCDL
jgi:hypothetical protein